MPLPCRKSLEPCPVNETIFRPRDATCDKLKHLKLCPEEVEAIRLKYLENKSQIECAKELGISQTTFHRVLQSANKKIADSLINRKALHILKKDMD